MKKPTLRVLYLFCGKPRKADVHHYLHKLSEANNFELHVREIDIERQASDNLLEATLWDTIFAELDSGNWDVILMSPPCNTFSRARFNWKACPGPRPLRNLEWPRGFPWLAGANLQLVKDHNYLVDQTIAAARRSAANGMAYLIEHPEDLGITSQHLAVRGHAPTTAGHKCHYVGSFPVPLCCTLSEAHEIHFQLGVLQ